MTESVKQLFMHNPDHHVVYVTEDGECFWQESYARAHQPGRITRYTREALVPAEQLADAANEVPAEEPADAANEVPAKKTTKKRK